MGVASSYMVEEQHSGQMTSFLCSPALCLSRNERAMKAGRARYQNHMNGVIWMLGRSGGWHWSKLWREWMNPHSCSVVHVILNSMPSPALHSCIVVCGGDTSANKSDRGAYLLIGWCGSTKALYSKPCPAIGVPWFTVWSCLPLQVDRGVYWGGAPPDHRTGAGTEEWRHPGQTGALLCPRCPPLAENLWPEWG